jgi:hypothetical protein
MFFRSLDRISHDASGTENFRIVERSRHDQCWSVNGTQAITSKRISHGSQHKLFQTVWQYTPPVSGCLLFLRPYRTFLSMCIAEAMVVLDEVVEVWTQSQFARV